MKMRLSNKCRKRNLCQSSVQKGVKSLRRALLDSLKFFNLGIMTHILFSRFGKMYVYVFIYYLVTMYNLTA